MADHELVVTTSGPISYELTDAIRICMAELVYALIIVSHNKKVGAELLQASNDLLITVVQVLILVNEHMLKAHLLANQRITVD